MKISEIIAALERQKAEIGDVDLVAETGDGRATWAEDAVPSIKYREIWPGHPHGKAYFISMV